MKKQSFDKVKQFLQKYPDAKSVEKDFVIRKVVETFYSNIVTQDANGIVTEKTPDEKNTIEDTITSEDNLTAYFDNAKKFYSDYENDSERLFRKKIGRESFIKSLGSNILANFIYALLLLAIFFVAKDQIKTWISSTNPDSRMKTELITKEE